MQKLITCNQKDLTCEAEIKIKIGDFISSEFDDDLKHH